MIMKALALLVNNLIWWAVVAAPALALLYFTRASIRECKHYFDKDRFFHYDPEDGPPTKCGYALMLILSIVLVLLSAGYIVNVLYFCTIHGFTMQDMLGAMKEIQLR